MNPTMGLIFLLMEEVIIRKKIVNKSTLNILFVIAIYTLFLNVTHIGCPIRFLTGVSCMGCGMSRALSAVIRLHFQEAVHYHPLVFFVPFIIVFMCIESKIAVSNKRLVKFVWIVIISSFFITYLVRLFSNDPVVQINIKDGLIFKMIKHLREEGITW